MKKSTYSEIYHNPDFGPEFVSELGNGIYAETERLKERKESVSNLKFNVLNFIKSLLSKKESNAEIMYAQIGSDYAAFLLNEYPNDYVDNNGTRIVSRQR